MSDTLSNDRDQQVRRDTRYSLEDSFGFQVVRTARSMKKVLDNRLAEIGLTATQCTVLSTLARHDGLSLSEIGNRVFLDKPAITGLADRLEEDGLVERSRNTRDRRVIELYLTAKGRGLIRKMNEIIASADEYLLISLQGSEQNHFRDMLDRIFNNANGKVGESNE